jgi:ABC-type branched-subunit amino acid transport system ATPase component
MSAAPTLEPSGLLLEATGIRKTFGGVQAVRGVDLHIAPGEIVGLIGPNGSGKSTMLGCLSRDIPIDEGKVMFEGRSLSKVGASRAARRGIGRTFQNIRVFPELTVHENALLARNWGQVSPLAMLGRADKACQARVDHLLALTEMTRLRGEFAGNLSGGQKRLLEFVMALVSEPRLVMLDEAASGVNPTLIEKLKSYVLRLRDEENVAFLVVEHNVDFIFTLADRIVVMETGSILAQGAPDTIRHNQEVIDAYLGA